MEQKICTYCGQSGHRASNCPNRPAECCTDIGADDLDEPMVPTWIVGVACAVCLVGYSLMYFI
jgi:hypothetical protein